VDDHATPPPPNRRCVACDAPFRCGIDDAAPCWCAREEPAVLPVPGAAAGCFCPACLHARIAAARVTAGHGAG